mmetsp:Transcript_72841/g.206714  ORF Transcript_72841/g.206714 Transcript_72841/m.206714 type:complete len:207 (+) Transcript_72841:701-1321(+)
MPPVLGPWSPSRARLWSWAAGIMAMVLPSQKAMQLHSSPSSSCSTTISLPASPKALSTMIVFTACRASSSDAGMSTPLPAAMPLALTTTSRPAAYSALTYSQAASCSPSVKFLKAAVGSLCLAKKLLEKAFEASSSAAAFEGPKHGTPAFLQASARPAQSGTSGPTKTKATFFSTAKATSPATSESATATLLTFGSLAVPPLPGAQ